MLESVLEAEKFVMKKSKLYVCQLILTRGDPCLSRVRIRVAQLVSCFLIFLVVLTILLFLPPWPLSVENIRAVGEMIDWNKNNHFLFCWLHIYLLLLGKVEYSYGTRNMDCVVNLQ